MIPQMDYCTNDIWELAAAYGTDNNFPIVLRCSYGAGRISIITIPDNMGDIYHYPVQILNVIRKLFEKEMPVLVEGPSKVQLFVYDNHKIILRSDLDYYENVTLQLSEGVQTVRDIIRERDIPAADHKITMQLTPCVNYVFELK